MIYTLKSIIRLLSICYLVFIFCFSSLLAEDNDTLSFSSTGSASSDEDWETFRQSHLDLLPFSKTQDFTSGIQMRFFNNLKKNNFKDYAAKDRMIYLYLYSIWNKIIETNKDLLSKYGKTSLEESFTLDWIITNKRSDAVTILSAMVLLIDEIFPYYMSDTYIASVLSHEISHILLNHDKLSYDLMEILGKQYEKDHNTTTSTLSVEEEVERKQQYIRNSSEYIALKIKHEIEADTLGFEIYLNAGFKAQDYTDSFLLLNISDRNPYFFLPFSLNLKKQLLQTLLNKKQQLDTEGISLQNYTDIYQLEMSVLRDALDRLNPIEKQIIHKTIEYMKYVNSTKDHPNRIWRFWNLMLQEQNKVSQNDERAINNDVTTVSYFRIDLSNLPRLKEIKEFLSNKDNLRLDLKFYDNTKDPRVYIIQELFKNNSQINFTLELNPKDSLDIGQLKDDNTILLRANDIFRIAVTLLRQDILGSSGSSSFCSDLFSNTKSSTLLDYVVKTTFIM